MIVSTVSISAMDGREHQTSSLNSIAIKQIVAEELEQISTKQNKELHKKKIVPVLQQLERRAPLKASKKLNLQSDILSVGLLKNEILEYLGGPHVKASLVFSGDRGLVPWIIVKQRDAMVKSIKSGDFEGLKKAYGLLDAYTSLFISPKAPKSSDFIKNYRLEYGMTLLHKAGSNGNIEVVRLLLDRGANVDTPDDYGWTPLRVSTSNGKVVRLLLDRGANVDTPDNYGWTSLCISAFDGRVEVVRLLLDVGASPDCKNNSGKTPDDCAPDPKIKALIAQARIDRAKKAALENQNKKDS